MALKMNEDDCWQAVLERRVSLPEPFLFGVITTGIYCRPSCPARRPKRENIRFFHNAAEAGRAGFRACQRCRPEEEAETGRDAEIVTRLCKQIEKEEDGASFADLARQAGFSASHLHRLFKKITGVTPKAYAEALKAQRVRGELADAETVTGAIYDAGYGSSSRFYEKADRLLGMTPRQYRTGGRGVTMVHGFGRCWLGKVLVATTERGICAIQFGEDEAELLRDLHARFPEALIGPAGPDFDAHMASVLAALKEPSLARALPLDIIGTAFQQRIWTALRNVPLGETTSYGRIAEEIGAPKAARAVAGACAANPIAVAIPCHRVVSAAGKLSGYRWGPWRKQALLEREAGSSGETS